MKLSAVVWLVRLLLRAGGEPFFRNPPDRGVTGNSVSWAGSASPELDRLLASLQAISRDFGMLRRVRPP